MESVPLSQLAYRLVLDLQQPQYELRSHLSNRLTDWVMTLDRFQQKYHLKLELPFVKIAIVADFHL